MSFSREARVGRSGDSDRERRVASLLATSGVGCTVKVCRETRRARRQRRAQAAVVLHCKAESHDLLAEYRGKSMPHFLFYRNGTRVASVAGANMPEIEALLREHAPASPDADALEENPMYVQRREEKAAAEAAAQAALMGENE